MATRRWILTFSLAVAISLSLACSSSSSNKSGGTAAVSIALNPAPPTTVGVGSTTGIAFTPVVSNDPGNYGVDWALTCPAVTPPNPGSTTCGTLSINPSFHSKSGTAVSYIPPANMQTGSLTVNVTVFATVDHTKNITTAVTVGSYVNVLNGTYVLQVQGTDGSNPFQATGAFVFDGKGNITSGEETYNTLTGFSAPYTVQGSNGTASTYFIGADGRGTITLNVQQVSNSANTITQQLSFVVLSSAKALVADLGDFITSSGAPLTVSGSGTLELQDTSAATTMPKGAYAFVTNGIDYGNNSNVFGFLATPGPTAIGGVINIDNLTAPGSISGAGSYVDQAYYVMNPSLVPKLVSCVPPTGVVGTVTQPDSFGSFVFLLAGASCFGAPPSAGGAVQLTGYIVDSSHIRLIESDDTSGGSGFLTAGIAVGQGSAAGTFNNASLSGPYVFGISGIENDNTLGGISPSYYPSSFTSAGVINADANGSFTGVTDTFYLSGGGGGFGALNVEFQNTPIHGTYTLDSATNAIGRVSLSPFIFQGGPPNPPTPHPTVLLYLTGNGNPPLALWSDGRDSYYPAVGTGETYVQGSQASGPLSFGNSETYGVNFTATTGTEDDGSGRVTANITANGTATLTGTIDDTNNNIILASGGGNPPLSFSGTFVPPTPADTSGRLTGGFIYDIGNGGYPPTSAVAYYMINNNQAFFIENDWETLNTNTGTGQVALGYFEQACDVTSATSCQAAAQASKKSSQSHLAGRRTRKQENRIGR